MEVVCAVYRTYRSIMSGLAENQIWSCHGSVSHVHGMMQAENRSNLLPDFHFFHETALEEFTEKFGGS